MQNKFEFKLKSDLRGLIGKFLKGIDGKICTDMSRFEELFTLSISSSSPVRHIRGYFIEATHDLYLQCNEIIEKICKSLGPERAARQIVSKIIWDEVVNRYEENISYNLSINRIEKEIQSIVDKSHRYIHPNYLVRLHPGILKMTLGPVSIVSIDALRNEFNLEHSGVRFVLRGEERNNSNLGYFEASKFNWDISVYALPNNIKEEATWLAGIASSLLILTVEKNLGIQSVCDNTGRPEASITAPIIQEKFGAIIGKDMVSRENETLPVFYEISNKVHEYCSTDCYQNFINKIFFPIDKTVGAALRYSLGWLARGRQSESRTDRFMFFFTALESLLTVDDKTAPVVQNIARSAACILTDLPAQRADYAKKIKELYSIRSKLVHAGQRDMSREEGMKIESLVRDICRRVLQYVDPATKLQDFHKALHNSSYGTPWMPKYERNFPSAPPFEV
nr:HEPN domain-containing protein [Acetobacter persici]